MLLLEAAAMAQILPPTPLGKHPCQHTQGQQLPRGWVRALVWGQCVLNPGIQIPNALVSSPPTPPSGERTQASWLL